MTYIVHVVSRNGVSDQHSGSISERTVTISITTDSSPPSSPQTVTIQGSATGQATLLTWEPPSNTYGTLVRYLILISTVNRTDTAEVRVRLSPNVQMFDLSELDIPSGTYYVWVSWCVIYL